MKLGRGHAAKSKPVALPERSQGVTLVPTGGKGLPARVLECGPDMLLVAIMVPTEPLTYRQLDGLVLEFVAPQARVRRPAPRASRTPRSRTSCGSTDRARSRCCRNVNTCASSRARPALVYGGPDKIPVQSYTVDVSGGGFLLAGPDSLKIGDEVQFQLTLTPGVLLISGTGKVVRVDAQGRRAVEFQSISELDRRRLIRFIFECQRAERQRGLETDGRYGS